MKKYEDPKMDVMIFGVIDIIRTSEEPDLGTDFGEGGTVNPYKYGN